MATPATEPAPLILTNAGIAIAPGAAAAALNELACVANHIEISPDVSTTTLDTMCGSRDYPGTVKWALLATLYQSFDALATEETLDAAVKGGEPVEFAVVGYRDKAVGPDNPMWTGLAIPQPYSPINGDAGDASEVDIEWSIVGEPTKLETGVYPPVPTVLAASNGGKTKAAA